MGSKMIKKKEKNIRRDKRGRWPISLSLAVGVVRPRSRLYAMPAGADQWFSGYILSSKTRPPSLLQNRKKTGKYFLTFQGWKDEGGGGGGRMKWVGLLRVKSFHCLWYSLLTRKMTMISETLFIPYLGVHALVRVRVTSRVRKTSSGGTNEEHSKAGQVHVKWTRTKLLEQRIR